MKKIKKICALLLCILFIIPSASCSETNTKPQSRVFYEYFDTVGIFYDYSGMSDDKFTEVANKVQKKLSEYHRLYDIYNEYDEITNLATLNKTAGEGPQKVDEKIIDLLLFSKEMYNFTDGKINVAMGSVLRIWHDYREEGTSVPPKEFLEAAREHTDINDIIIDETNRTVQILDSELSIDVGAVAKGYAVEMTAAMLEAEGYTGCVIDVGGNLRAIGTKPNGDGWTAGVRNPDLSSSNAFVYTFELKNQALVTSGSYERFYTVDGVNYHHIINGDTLMPENYYLSVTVKTDSSAFSDALSTAIFNMKYEDAEKFVEGIKNITVVFVMPDGEVRTVSGK